MAKERYAIIKKDPPESYSTGGLVVGFCYKYTGEGEPHHSSLGENFGVEAGHELIRCEDESVVIGWIKQDKTNILKDPNT